MPKMSRVGLAAVAVALAWAAACASGSKLSAAEIVAKNVAARGGLDAWRKVDTKTFQDIRYDRIADGPAGAQRRVSVRYGDYRAVDGLQIPFLIQTGTGSGTSPDRMQIERVALNVPLADAMFESPAAPHPPSTGARPGVASHAAASAPPSTAPEAPAGEGVNQ